MNDWVRELRERARGTYEFLNRAAAEVERLGALANEPEEVRPSLKQFARVLDKRNELQAFLLDILPCVHPDIRVRIRALLDGTE